MLYHDHAVRLCRTIIMLHTPCPIHGMHTTDTDEIYTHVVAQNRISVRDDLSSAQRAILRTASDPPMEHTVEQIVFVIFPHEFGFCNITYGYYRCYTVFIRRKNNLIVCYKTIKKQ